MGALARPTHALLRRDPRTAMGDRKVKFVGAVGAFANWMIPLAAIASFKDDPSRINPGMTGVLAVYSVFFMRWALAIRPPNYALFACHVANSSAQLIQLGRYTTHSLKDSSKSS